MPKLHRNARTCPHCRSLIVRRVTDGGQKPTTVARDFMVTERTVSKWLKRFRAEGARGLEDRTSRPNHIPLRYLQPGEELRDAVFAVLHTVGIGTGQSDPGLLPPVPCGVPAGASGTSGCRARS
jgi:hypothetical protein